MKHDSWNAGDGEFLSIPVTIMQPPMNISAPEPVKAPSDWAPQVFEAQAFEITKEGPEESHVAGSSSDEEGPSNSADDSDDGPKVPLLGD